MASFRWFIDSTELLADWRIGFRTGSFIVPFPWQMLIKMEYLLVLLWVWMEPLVALHQL
jgi:hypothetical protein